MKHIFFALAVTANLSTPARADEHRVTIKAMAFTPRVLNVAIGDTVVFANAGSAAHTATATDGAFDTGRIRSGEVVRIKIATRGPIDFICDYHPSMRGRIIAN